MSLPTQRNLLRGFIQSMYDEGIVNDSFYQLQAMKETIRPDFVVRSVASYCKNVPNLFSQMSYLVNQPQVNFEKVKDTANDLYWRTSNVGAERVKAACGQIIRACDDNNKELCTQALYWTKKEYSSLRGRFETLVQVACDPLVHIMSGCTELRNAREPLLLSDATHLIGHEILEKGLHRPMNSAR